MAETEKLQEFLTDLGLGDILEKLQNDDFDMSNIADLTVEELKEYGVSKGKTKNFMKAVEKLKHDTNVTQSQSLIDFEPDNSTSSRRYQRRKPNRSFSTNEVPRIILLGATGSGKSLLGNTLLGWDKFAVSSEASSCTYETSEVERGFWNGDGGEFEIIDCPGLNDSEGRDTQHIADTVVTLKKTGFVNAFLIVRNGQEPRLSNSYIDMFKIFEMVFGDRYWSQVIFDVSRGGDVQTHKRWIQEIKNRFPNAAKAELKSVFLDTKVHDTKFDENLQKLWKIVSGMSKFECKHITAVMDEKDKLATENANLQKVLDEERERLEDTKHKIEQELATNKADFQKVLVEERERLDEAKQKVEQELESQMKKLEEEKASVHQKYEEQLKGLEGDIIKRNKDEMERHIEIQTLKTREDMKKDYEAKLSQKITEFESKIKEEKERLQTEITERNKEEMERKIEITTLKVKESMKNEYDKKLAEKEGEHKKELEKKDKVLEEETKKYLTQKNELLNNIKEEQQRFQTQITERNKEEMEKNMEIQTLKTKAEIELEYKKELEKKDKDLEEERKRHEEERRNFEKANLEKVKMEQEEKKHNTENETKKKLEVEKEKGEQERLKHEELQGVVTKTEIDFKEKYPSLFSKQGNSPTPGVELVNALKQSKDQKLKVKRFQVEVHIPLNKKEDIQNREHGIAARMFKTVYPSKESGWLSGWFQGSDNKKKRNVKTIMLLGLTGTGKSTFIDALVNYIFDIRYEDQNRLRLIQMTRDEKEKNAFQSQSQTDHIVVYHIEALPDMKIDFDLRIIDTPGFGDTRGIEYDKKLMKNIEDLFKSKKIDSLDAVGFVARAGDARLTAQQKYIFESILHIFGKDVEENLLSILTCYDGMKVNILDSFEEANMQFVVDVPVNSEAIFLPGSQEPVTRKTMENDPTIVNYHKFFESCEMLIDALTQMKPKSLDQTVEVLKDREHIDVEMQGLHHHVQELLAKKDIIKQETDICNQHKENVNATADTEYEVEEQHMKKVQLEYGKYVTNCLVCNRTCHASCIYSNDSDKASCSAMTRGGTCSVCPKNCHWSKHVNNPYRIEFEVKKVKKTYQEIVDKHNDFLKKHDGQKTVIDALKHEKEGISKEIQGNVQKIMVCLRNLKQNALRPDSSSTADYIDEMIAAEKHGKKLGYQARIQQLREEKDKAEMMIQIQEGADPDSF